MRNTHLLLCAALVSVACSKKNTEPDAGVENVAAIEDVAVGEVAEGAEDPSAAPAAAARAEQQTSGDEPPAAAPADGDEAVVSAAVVGAIPLEDVGGGRAAPTKGSMPCEGITSALATWHDGGAARVAEDAEGRASVVVSLAAADAALPDSFVESSRRETTAYGHVSKPDLCGLAASDGVQSVRSAAIASPK